MAKSSKSTQILNTPLRSVDRFLWDAGNLANEQSILFSQPLLTQMRQQLQSLGVNLNIPQWEAWERALSYRLTLIWGPPGTGKSQTLRTLVEALNIFNQLTQKPLRLLLSASNYNAFDNILVDATTKMVKLGNPNLSVYRLHSISAAPLGQTSITDVVTDASTTEFQELENKLNNPQGLIVVAATPDQTYNFIAKRGNSSPVAELFDFIIIDEASQMDVGHSIPLLCGASNNVQIVLAGDPMQLAPIHKVPPPLDAEFMVGSVYSYIKERFKLSVGSEQQLQINYRSNDEIVSFGRNLCYGRNYHAESPNLRLSLNLPQTKPSNWPNFLEWSPLWVEMLNPDVPIVCFSYSEGRSGQSNSFESQVVTCLLWLLYNAAMEQQLLGHSITSFQTLQNNLHSFDTFWKSGVGVVTPHSAQRAMIIGDLKKAFNTNFKQSRLIRSAVDTVEHFQGQQRDVILASFAVGDPDVVQSEDEFLLTLNRFNVMASRPRAKLIVLVTDEILDYLSSDEEILKGSRAIKYFAGNFCRNPKKIGLPWRDNSGNLAQKEGILKTVP